MTKYKCKNCQKEVTLKELMLDKSLGEINNKREFKCKDCKGKKGTHKKKKTTSNKQTKMSDSNKLINKLTRATIMTFWIAIISPIPFLILLSSIFSPIIMILSIILICKDEPKAGLINLSVFLTGTPLIWLAQFIFYTWIITN